MLTNSQDPCELPSVRKASKRYIRRVYPVVTSFCV